MRARALALNPDLSIAHNQYAYLEVDLGRAVDAMVRLLARAERQRNDPELFAGLVHACRYSGLLDASAGGSLRAMVLALTGRDEEAIADLRDGETRGNHARERGVRAAVSTYQRAGG